MTRRSASTITDDQLDDLYGRLDAIARIADSLTDTLTDDSWDLADAIERLARGTATVAEITAELRAA